MKAKKKRSISGKAKKWDSLKPPTAEPLPAKKIKNKKGQNTTQYPPVVEKSGDQSD